MSGSFFPHLIFQLFAPELHHGFPGTFRGPEHLESSFVAGLAHKQRCFALFPHPATCRLLIIHLRLHTHTHSKSVFKTPTHQWQLQKKCAYKSISVQDLWFGLENLKWIFSTVLTDNIYQGSNWQRKTADGRNAEKIRWNCRFWWQTETVYKEQKTWCHQLVSEGYETCTYGNKLPIREQSHHKP